MNLDEFKIIDISPVISSEIAVWPGDIPYAQSVQMDIKKDHLHLSSIASTLHLGAHTDSPLHYSEQGEDMAQRDLGYYIGKCQVVEVKESSSGVIQKSHVQSINLQSPRVLFKTGSFPDPNHFNRDFCSLSAELVSYLAHQGVRLVGLDTPSIDPFESKELLAHKEVYKHNMAILEGVVLDQVEEGIYQLIATPLKIVKADASPVRAILLKNQKA